jgi:hypothetical protein
MWKLAEQLGAVHTANTDTMVTHVVALDPRTDKARWARNNGKFLVNPGWIMASNEHQQLQEGEQHYRYNGHADEGAHKKEAHKIFAPSSFKEGVARCQRLAVECGAIKIQRSTSWLLSCFKMNTTGRSFATSAQMKEGFCG